jgi:hypothetical protein
VPRVDRWLVVSSDARVTMIKSTKGEGGEERGAEGERRGRGIAARHRKRAKRDRRAGPSTAEEHVSVKSASGSCHPRQWVRYCTAWMVQQGPDEARWGGQSSSCAGCGRIAAAAEEPGKESVHVDAQEELLQGVGASCPLQGVQYAEEECSMLFEGLHCWCEDAQ